MNRSDAAHRILLDVGVIFVDNHLDPLLLLTIVEPPQLFFFVCVYNDF